MLRTRIAERYSLAQDLYGTTIVNGSLPIGESESHQSSSLFSFTDGDLKIERTDTIQLWWSRNAKTRQKTRTCKNMVNFTQYSTGRDLQCHIRGQERMLSKKSRHMRSFANFGSRRLILPVLRRRIGMILVIRGSILDEAIGFRERRSNSGATYGKRSKVCILGTRR